MHQASPPAAVNVSFAEALRLWLRVGLLSFGGPAAQIAVMHKLVVEERRWVDDQKFINGLNFCMLLPGPEAQQLATWLGWTLHGVRGGLSAGLLFILPGSAAMLVLGWLYTEYRELPALAGLFFGLQCAVLAVLADALRRLSRRVLKSRPLQWLAAATCLLMLVADVPFIGVVVAAAAAGWVFGRFRGSAGSQQREKASSSNPASPPLTVSNAAPGWRYIARVLSTGLAVWFAPLILASCVAGSSSVFTQTGLFFSRAAVVTFGGAYAVLGYVDQQAVEKYSWLERGEMLDGLGLAETTPGPLILVVQFVGHVACWRHATEIPPALAGILGAMLATWVTFAPSFLWIFLGAPWIEQIPRIRGLTTALQAISAVVVGVIGSLSFELAGAVLCSEQYPVHLGPVTLQLPLWSALRPDAAAVALLGAFLLFGLRASLGLVLVACVVAGLALRLVL
ncbi:MAG: chromate efflux transporter [Planctomycetota bacterium]